MKFLKTSLVEIKKSKKYRSIMSCWQNQYTLYSLVPISKIIKILEVKEFNIFKKCQLKSTNFNYTLFSNETSRPVMSIDFANDGHRFEEEGEFVLIKKSENTIHENRIFELKFEFARKIKYPYFLINIDDPVFPDRKTHMQIVRSVVGFYLARRKISAMAREFLKNDSSIINELDSWDCSNYIRDFILIPIKIESDRKFNYLRKLNKKYKSEIIKKGYSYNTTELILPAGNETNKTSKNNISDFEVQNISIDEKEFTAICELKTRKKNIIETVIVKTSLEAPVMELARELSKLSAFRKALM